MVNSWTRSSASVTQQTLALLKILAPGNQDAQAGRVKLSAQLWLDADLGYDGGLHQGVALRLRYARNAPVRCASFYMTDEAACSHGYLSITART